LAVVQEGKEAERQREREKNGVDWTRLKAKKNTTVVLVTVVVIEVVTEVVLPSYQQSYSWAYQEVMIN
jgi:hypothetical protein